MTLGELNSLIQADINGEPALAEVSRAVDRVIKDINRSVPTERKSELAFERMVINTTESLIFASADPDTIVTTTDISSGVLPGDMVVIYGTAENDGVYTLGKISTVTITLVGDDRVNVETISSTIAIIRPKYREIVSEVFANITYDNTAKTVVETDNLINFEELGVKAKDVVIFTGATETVNNQAFSIASASQYTLTLQSDETLTADTTDPCRMRIIRPSTSYLFDTETYRLTLPPYVKKVMDVYENDVKLEDRGFAYISDSTNSSELAYSTIERTVIQLPSGLMTAANDELRIELLKEYELITDAKSGVEIDIPQQFLSVLQAGTLFYLLAMPKYRDEILFGVNQTEYKDGLKDIARLEVAMHPERNEAPEYKY